jgi:DNA-binding MarR family transcriptional regulator
MAKKQPVEISGEEVSFHRMNDTFMKIAKIYIRQHDKNQDFGIRNKLCRAEIHTIQAVGNNEGINLTELARVLDVTKPTVSERIAKLARLKLVRKQTCDENQKEIRLALTDKGWTAYHNHEKQHQDIFRLFERHFGNRTPEFLQDFEEQLNDFYAFLLALRKGKRFFQ